MKGDFTRSTFRTHHHYRAVLHQQGRVQLDADANEQVAIQAHLDETVTADTVGPHGGPLPGAGFAIGPAGPVPGEVLDVGAGRYYVDGILCENEAAVPLAGQPDLPAVPLPDEDGRYAAYLDVWREHLTAYERPELREVALGGPDTTTRTRTVWQVRLVPVPAGQTCADLAPPWQPEGLASTGQLKARAEPPAEAEAELCVIPETAGYRRLENQLYRVEILDGGGVGAATVLWSRDNGTVVERLTELVEVAGATRLTLASAGRDERLGFRTDQWVEVTDLHRTRRGEPGFVGRVTDADGPVLTIADWHRDTAPAADALDPETRIVRRWDSPDGPQEVTEETWQDLEDGVQVQFAAGGTYRTGDHWLVPARTASLREDGAHLAGNVEWPQDGGEPAFQPRHGIVHHVAALALLERGGGDWTVVADCRRLFPPVTALTSLAYAGGDGQEAMPGEPVPLPLQVAVRNGATPVAGAPIRFTAASGTVAHDPRLLDEARETVEVTTDADGLARCYWQLPPESTGPPAPGRPPGAVGELRVRAQLLRSDATPVGTPVDFGAGLSVADQVAYRPGSCAALAGAGTVQEALHTLARTTTLLAVGGDGQSGDPGGDLPFPVVVQVRSDCGPVPGARVQFRVASGAVAEDEDALDAGEAAVDLPTGDDGLATCFWRLGGAGEPVQTLHATLGEGIVGAGAPAVHQFTATVRNATDRPPALHVQQVGLVADRSTLDQGAEVTADQLREGIAVELDGPPEPAAVDGQPVATLTVELPYPLTAGERDEWGFDLPVGTRPLTLAGDARAERELVVWQPREEVVAFLQRVLVLLSERKLPAALLCHLWLSGRDIAGDDGRLVLPLNGLALRGQLPTVDDVRAADYRLWFQLVGQIERLVVVPTRDGLLRMVSMRNAVTLSAPSGELRAAVPTGTRLLATGEPDLDAARAAVNRAFRSNPDDPRRLVLVTTAAYADAGAVLATGLGQVDVALALIVADDPGAVAAERLAAGDPVDGVLIATSGAAAVRDLGGFQEQFAL